MNKEEAREVLKESLAILAVNYPQLVRRLSNYISTHPDKDEAISVVVSKLMDIQSYAEGILREELDIDPTSLRNAN